VTEKRTLLCPVPAEHMRDAIKACNVHKSVAFRSNRYEMFYDATTKAQKIDEGTRVLICVTQSGNHGQAAADFFKEKQVTYEARYVQWTPADAGIHPNPNLRPRSAKETDSKFEGFWEIRELKERAFPIKLDGLTGWNTKSPVLTMPRRPMFVFDPSD
jgi:hypothetical protein